MQIGETLYVTTRAQWRKWLSEYHALGKDIWLIFYKNLQANRVYPMTMQCSKP